MRKSLAILLAAMVLSLCACSGTGASVSAGGSATSSSGVQQYDYQLNAGETTEVYDTVFEEMVTVTVDPASTRDGSIDLRSSIYFGNCTFNGGLTVVGDYHAMVTLDSECSFGDGSVVTCQEATSGAAQATNLEDNLVKVLICCEGVTVETDAAVGVLSDKADFTLNGTTYSKESLAPDAGFLGVYALYEGQELSYLKLAIGEDDSVEVLA